jgi:glycerol-3-phosphate O-acyltransferase
MSHEAPIFGFNAAKPAIVSEVIRRVCEQTRDPLHALNEAAYLESRRLRPDDPEREGWQRLAGRLGRMSQEELRAALREHVERYAWDVAGNFDPRVYTFASRAMAPILGTLLSPRSALRNAPKLRSLAALDDRIVVEGPTAHLRKLAEKGTLVFVPTHLSNLDSVVFGFALERSELPPATYGAGKNLFTNPVLSFFMHNLGAYRVDRRLRHALYKDVLKAYSCVLIERGYHSLFFPGGTRSRSGAVERKLKLGLAGTALEAFARTAQMGRPQNVYFVPSTINYLLTLEAESLIDDYLQEEGKARYLIESDDDESTRVGRVAAFAQKLLGLDASVVIRFGKPLDCFGNEVDEEGRSHDARGRLVDPLTYVLDRNDRPTVDPARDAQYTRELGEAICEAYKRDTVIMSTHLVATCAFSRLRQIVGKADVFAILNHKGHVVVPRSELTADVGRLRDRARELVAKGELRLGAVVESDTPEGILNRALRAFAGYHTQEVLGARGRDLVLTDTRLLFYYQNRLAAHGLAFDAVAPRRS